MGPKTNKSAKRQAEAGKDGLPRSLPCSSNEKTNFDDEGTPDRTVESGDAGTGDLLRPLEASLVREEQESVLVSSQAEPDLVGPGAFRIEGISRNGWQQSALTREISDDAESDVRTIQARVVAELVHEGEEELVQEILSALRRNDIVEAENVAAEVLPVENGVPSWVLQNDEQDKALGKRRVPRLCYVCCAAILIVIVVVVSIAVTTKRVIPTPAFAPAHARTLVNGTVAPTPSRIEPSTAVPAFAPSLVTSTAPSSVAAPVFSQVPAPVAAPVANPALAPVTSPVVNPVPVPSYVPFVIPSIGPTSRLGANQAASNLPSNAPSTRPS